MTILEFSDKYKVISIEKHHVGNLYELISKVLTSEQDTLFDMERRMALLLLAHVPQLDKLHNKLHEALKRKGRINRFKISLSFLEVLVFILSRFDTGGVLGALQIHLDQKKLL